MARPPLPGVLDPELAAFLALANGAGAPPLSARPLAEARLAYEQASLALDLPDTSGDERVQALSLSGPAGPIAARLYRPAAGARAGDDAWPVLLFFHGGGYTLGSLDSHDSLCRSLASHTPCAVLAVDYRLAPEHPFPAAFEDAWAAHQGLLANGAAWGLDTRRVAVGGDSVGGTLATAVSLALREAGGVAQPLLQVLLYPCTAAWQDTPSHRAFGKGYLLEGRTLQWMFQHCLRSDADRLDWRFAPLQAEDLGGLPPAFVAVAEFDPLIDEGVAYAERLAAAGVRTQLAVYEGMVHDFARLGSLVDAAGQVRGDAARALAGAFW
jgi:acetyl esterase